MALSSALIGLPGVPDGAERNTMPRRPVADVAAERTT